jgi:hypothetical protein
VITARRDGTRTVATQPRPTVDLVDPCSPAVGGTGVRGFVASR